MTLLLVFGVAVAGALALAVYAIRVMMGDRPKVQIWTPPDEAAPHAPSSGVPQRPSRRLTPSGRVALPGLPPTQLATQPTRPARMARGSTPPPLPTVPVTPGIPLRAPAPRVPAGDHERTHVHDERRANLRKVYR